MPKTPQRKVFEARRNKRRGSLFARTIGRMGLDKNNNIKIHPTSRQRKRGK